MESNLDRDNKKHVIIDISDKALLSFSSGPHTNNYQHDSLGFLIMYKTAAYIYIYIYTSQTLFSGPSLYIPHDLIYRGSLFRL